MKTDSPVTNPRVAPWLAWICLAWISIGVLAAPSSATRVTVHDVTLREGTGGEVVARFPVTVSPPSAAAIEVEYETIEGSARAGLDFEPRRGTLVIPAGTEASSIAIPIFPDSLAEGVETFELEIQPSADFELASRRAVATLLNDDVPSVSVLDAAALEGSSFETPVRVPVTLSIPSAIPVSVRVSLVDGTALAASDYTATNGVVVFLPGSQREDFVFFLRPDPIAEFNETIGVRLSYPTNATLGTASAQVLVLDDDPTPSISVVGGTVDEPTGETAQLNFKVRLSGPSTQPVRVSYSTRNGSATAGIDFLARLGTLVIPPGVIESTLAVTILGDAIAEPDEAFSMLLRNPVNATLGAAESSGQIRDDDRPLTVSVSDASTWEGSRADPQGLSFLVFLSSPATNTVVVRYQAEPGTAVVGGDFPATQGSLTFVPIGTGSTQHVVRIPIVGDDIPEPNERLRLRLYDPDNVVLGRSEAEGEILNDDGTLLVIDDQTVTEGDRADVTASFVVRRLGPAQETVTASYATHALTARADTDFVPRTGRVTFLPGETRATIPVTIRADLLDEPDETFEVRLSEAEGATLFRSVAVGTVIDDDLPALHVDPVTVAEGSSGPTFARFVVRLDSTPTQEASVDFAVRAGTALEGEDFLPVSGTLVFPLGITERQVAVAVVGDTLDEADETFSLLLSHAQSAGISSEETVATLVDDDPLPFVTLEDAEARECSGPASEGGMDFVVRLSAPSGREVRIPFQTRPITASPGSDFAGTTNEVVFAAGSTRQTVRIPILCDDEDERDELFEVILDAPRFAVLSRARARGRILDDDPPTLLVGDLRLDEGSPGSGTNEVLVTVSLSSAAPEVIAIDYHTLDGSAKAGADYVAVSDTLVILPGTTRETLRIPLVPDAVPEDDETFRIVLANPRNIRLERDTAEITILDDDPPLVLFDDVRIVEGHTGVQSVTVPFRLSRTNASTVSLAYASRGGTAVSGEDFIPVQGTLVFAPGELEAEITVSTLGDTRVEATESFTLELTSAVNATLERTNVVVTLVDDEQAPVLSLADHTVDEGPDGPRRLALAVTLSAESALPIRVLARTVAETAEAGVDFVATNLWLEFPAGTLSRTFEVTVLDDGVTERQESFRVELSEPENATLDGPPARIVVRDDDPPLLSGTDVTLVALRAEPTVATVTLTLSQPSPEPVLVPYATTNGTAVAGEDFTPVSATLVFLPGETRRTLEIAVARNTPGEGEERFGIRIEPPTNAVAERSRIDILLLAEPEPNLPPRVTLAVLGSGTDVTVGTPVDLAAEASDPEGAPLSVTFHAGDFPLDRTTAPPFTMRWTPRELGDFDLTARATDAAGLASTSAPVRLRVLEPAVVHASPISVAEGFGTARIPVTLSRPAREPVSLRIATRADSARAGTDFVSLADTLVFDPGVTNRTLDVRLIDDTLPEPVETFHLDFGSPENAVLEQETLAITVLDDDVAPATNRPPQVTLSAPMDLAIARPGDSMLLRAEASDAEGPVVRVDFLVDDAVLGTVSSAPFEWEWRAANLGDHRIRARAFDREGATTDSAPVRIAVTEACGQIALVTPRPDVESATLQEYLFELGLPSIVLDRASASVDTLRGFDLVIWLDGGVSELPPEAVRTAVSVAAAGVPLYFVGERFVDSYRGMDTETQAVWAGLFLIRPGALGEIPDRVELAADEWPASVAAIVHGGKVGDVTDFDYPFASSLGSRSEPDGEVVLARAGTAEVLVARPGNVELGGSRRVSQAFAASLGGSDASRAERKKLFLNAVWWLLGCSGCTDLNLVPFATIEPAPAPESDDLLVTVQVHATGACEALAARATCHLPPHLRWVRAESGRGTWEVDASRGTVTFLLGRLASGSVETLRLVVRPVRSGDVTVRVVLGSLNEAAGALADNQTEVSTHALGPPGLAIRPRSPGLLELVIEGRSGIPYLVESAPTLLGPWTETETVVLPADASTARLPIETAASPRFFRVQAP